MHEPLDQYLATVRKGLRTLPPAEQESEIAELRQHLEMLSLVHEELEDSKNRVAAAIEQFGQASMVRRRLVAAYRRRRLARFRHTWFGAVLCTVFSAALGATVSSYILFPFGRSLVGENINAESLSLFIVSFCVALFLECWFIGWLSSRLSGWRCLPVIAIWIVFFYCIYAAPQFRHEDMPYAIWMQTVITTTIIMATPLLSAFVGLKRQLVLRRA
ncbi:MAG: hypothetical protein V4671_17740 [Armatimonadota bacterium]